MQPHAVRIARRGTALAAAALVLAGATACGGARPAPKAAPGAVAADRWAPPRAAGPPSVGGFCALLVADYRHIAAVARAPKLSVREQIVKDYVSFAPAVMAAAPPQIAPAARLYLTSIATVMGDLDAAGLDAAKVSGTRAATLVTDPQVVSAGDQLLAFSRQYCHYDIASATP